MTVTFDSVELINTTYNTRFSKHETVADRILNTLPLAREDGEVLISERYGKKYIRLQGFIKGSSQANLEAAIDTFTEVFSRAQKNLDIVWGGGTRRYVATCTKHDFDRDHFHISIVPWVAEFVVLSGEGKDTSDTTALNATALSLSTPDTDSFVMSGSKRARPKITITGNTWQSTLRGIQFMNLDTGEKIDITRSGGAWGTTRSIVIDCALREVTTDLASAGTQVAGDFYGVFPEFLIGTNNFKVTAGYITCQSLEPTALLISSGANLSATTSRIGQSFRVPYTDGTFSALELYLDKTGAPGNLTVRIETDNGGKPSGTLVDANATATVAHTAVSTSKAFVRIDLSGFISLSANTVYWIVAKAAATVDGSNLYTWWYWPSTSDGAYTKGNGSRSFDSGATYSDEPAQSYIFKLLYGGQAAGNGATITVTYPKTYL